MDWEDLEYEDLGKLRKRRHSVSKLFDEILTPLSDLIYSSQLLSSNKLQGFNKKILEISFLVDDESGVLIRAYYPLSVVFNIEKNEAERNLISLRDLIDHAILKIDGLIRIKESEELMTKPSNGQYCSSCNQRPCCCSDYF